MKRQLTEYVKEKFVPPSLRKKELEAFPSQPQINLKPRAVNIKAPQQQQKKKTPKKKPSSNARSNSPPPENFSSNTEQTASFVSLQTDVDDQYDPSHPN